MSVSRIHTNMELEAVSGGAPISSVVLAHDWLVGMRGGELVLDRLAAMFGPTDLYVLVHDHGVRHSPAIERCRIRTSIMQRWPGGPTRLRRWYLPMYPRAVDSLHIPDDKFEILISTSSALIKSIRPPRGHDGRIVPHICYCHTPPRYLWDQHSDYRGADLRGRLRSTGLAASRNRLREYDRRCASRVTEFVANSSHTARRIKACYRRDAVVIHPPVEIDLFTCNADGPRDDIYLAVSALEPYKRIDLAIEASKKLGFRLHVVGDGSERERLRALARGHHQIEFLGARSRCELAELYRSAKALLFPGMEDFGIVPVEAMACGCPVIAFHRGGSEDWMAEQCGLTFTEPTTESLVRAVRSFDRTKVESRACRANALRFAAHRFDKRITAVIDRHLESARSGQPSRGLRT